MPYLADQDKAYVATLRLGVVTDTGDLSGRVLSTSAVGSVDRAQIEAAARGFVGRIKQVPPMYSAVHHQGRRLYELARRGGRGRARAARGGDPRDRRRGRRRGVRAALDRVWQGHLHPRAGRRPRRRPRLRRGRRATGPDARGAVRARRRRRPGRCSRPLPRAALWARVQPAAATLPGWPSIRLDARATERFEHGQPVSVAPAGAADGTLVRVHAADGRMLGVGEVGARRATDPAGADPSCRSSGASSPSRLTPVPAWSPSAPSMASTSGTGPFSARP